MKIPLGTVAYDADDKAWVYVGHRLTSVGTTEHHLILAKQGQKGVSAYDWQYKAVKPETLLKKFPDLTRFA